MQSHFWNVLIPSNGSATVNGMPIDMVGVPNVYTAVYRHLSGVARQVGRPVLARGVDELQGGQVAWFTVDADGRATAARPPEPAPANPSASPTSAPAPLASPPSAPVASQPSAPPPVASQPTPPRQPAPSAPVPPSAPVAPSAPIPPIASSAPRQPQAMPAAPRPAAPEPAPPRPQVPAVAPVPAPALRQPVVPPPAPAPVPQHGDGTVLFVRPPRSVPQDGLRGSAYRCSGGRVNLGPSSAQLRLEERAARVARHLERPYSTAFLSFKGGIGKTSTTVGVGLTLAQMRGAPPVGIDANPDSGDLAERMLGETDLLRINPRNITDLVHDIGRVQSWTDLSSYVVQADRFHVVAGEQDPAVSDSLTAEGYNKIHDLLRHYFSVILTDCGTGVTHNAMSGILAKADTVVIAAGYAVSGAKRAASTLQWLAQHGYERLAQDALVVLTDKDGVSARVQKDVIRDHLASHCRGVFVVPNDPAVADGDRIDLRLVRPRTREAWAEVAAAVIDGYH